MKTDRRKLAEAFLELRALGYVAAMNFWCCQSCAVYALAHPVDGPSAAQYVFWHTQDDAAFDDHNEADEDEDETVYTEDPNHEIDPARCGRGMLRHRLYVAWAGDGHQIVDVLRRHHLLVEWDGSADTRIAVLAYGREEG
jgi:hypothetical protein